MSDKNVRLRSETILDMIANYRKELEEGNREHIIIDLLQHHTKTIHDFGICGPVDSNVVHDIYAAITKEQDHTLVVVVAVIAYYQGEKRGISFKVFNNNLGVNSIGFLDNSKDVFRVPSGKHIAVVLDSNLNTTNFGIINNTEGKTQNEIIIKKPKKESNYQSSPAILDNHFKSIYYGYFETFHKSEKESEEAVGLQTNYTSDFIMMKRMLWPTKDGTNPYANAPFKDKTWLDAKVVVTRDIAGANSYVIALSTGVGNSSTHGIKPRNFQMYSITSDFDLLHLPEGKFFMVRLNSNYSLESWSILDGYQKNGIYFPDEDEFNPDKHVDQERYSQSGLPILKLDPKEDGVTIDLEYENKRNKIDEEKEVQRKLKGIDREIYDTKRVLESKEAKMAASIMDVSKMKKRLEILETKQKAKDPNFSKEDVLRMKREYSPDDEKAFPKDKDGNIIFPNPYVESVYKESCTSIEKAMNIDSKELEDDVNEE